MKSSDECSHGRRIGCRQCQADWKRLWEERNALEVENLDLKRRLASRMTLVTVEAKP